MHSEKNMAEIDSRVAEYIAETLTEIYGLPWAVGCSDKFFFLTFRGCEIKSNDGREVVLANVDGNYFLKTSTPEGQSFMPVDVTDHKAVVAMIKHFDIGAR